MPLTSFVKKAKKLNFSISQLSHLTNDKENMPFWTNSKASLGESHLLLFFPIIPAWYVDVKVRCEAATLQMWGCKPEGKGLHGRQKGRKLDSTSVPDGIPEPSSQLWIVSSRLIFVMNYTHTHTIFKRRDVNINMNSEIFFMIDYLACAWEASISYWRTLLNNQGTTLLTEISKT